MNTVRMFKKHITVLDMCMQLYGKDAFSHFNGKLRSTGRGYMFSGWESLRFSTKARANQFMDELFARSAKLVEMDNELIYRCNDRRALMETVVSHFAKGPYTVHLLSQPTIAGWTHAVRDGERRNVVLGRLDWCEQTADAWSTKYAEWLMVKP